MTISFEDIMGKTLLVGITYYDKNGGVEKREQYYGTVIGADKHTGIAVRLEKGDVKYLPPDTSSMNPAPEGDYRLHSTGETVHNPDYFSTWQIYPNDDNGGDE